MTSVQNPFQQVLDPLPDMEWRSDDIGLLVVDMQYFDAHPDWGEGLTAKRLGVLNAFDEYFMFIKEIIPRIQGLLRASRRQGIEVIHLRVAELTRDSRDAGWKQLVRGLAVPVNSKEAEPLEEVAPIGDEIVISKSSSGAFATTNLDRILRNLGIKTLLFTGTATGGCVESTARDAADLGYEVIVVSDACADSTHRSHQKALQRMAAMGIRTSPTADMLEVLEGLPVTDREAKSGIRRAEACIPKVPEARDSIRSPYDLIFGPAVDLPLTRSGSALLLVDTHRYVCDPSMGLGRLAAERGEGDTVAPFYDRVAGALGRIAVLLEGARASGMFVVHVRTAGHASDGRDLAPHLRVRGIRPILSTPEAEFMREVAPLPGEVVLAKPGSAVCTGTGLDELLRNAGIETVILAGVSFDGGVEGSMRSLTDRGYGVILVPDACATYHDATEASLWKMETGITRISSSRDLLHRLQELNRRQVVAPSG